MSERLSHNDEQKAKDFVEIEKDAGQDVSNLLDLATSEQQGAEYLRQHPEDEFGGDTAVNSTIRAQKYESAAKSSPLALRRDANLWQAQQHVSQHLPEYKATAAAEMQAETGMDFHSAANDAQPPVVNVPLETKE